MDARDARDILSTINKVKKIANTVDGKLVKKTIVKKAKAVAKKVYKALGQQEAEPLTRKQYDYVLSELRCQGNLRGEIICRFLFSCLRIGDVLKNLKIGKIFDVSGGVRDTVTLREEKRNKKRIIDLKNTELGKLLAEYYPQIKHLPRESVLFYTKKTGVALSPNGWNKIMRNEFVGRMNIGQISGHSFRKSCLRWLATEKSIPVNILMRMAGHSNTETTLKYCLLSAEDVRTAQSLLVE